MVFEHAHLSDSRDIWKCGTVNTRGYFSGILVTNRAGAWEKTPRISHLLHVNSHQKKWKQCKHFLGCHLLEVFRVWRLCTELCVCVLKKIKWKKQLLIIIVVSLRKIHLLLLNPSYPKISGQAPVLERFSHDGIIYSVVNLNEHIPKSRWHQYWESEQKHDCLRDPTLPWLAPAKYDILVISVTVNIWFGLNFILSYYYLIPFVFNISIMPKYSVLKSITIRHPVFLLKANEMWFFETCATGLGSRRPSERSDDLPKSSVKHWRAGWRERLSCWARVKTRLL